MFVERIDRHSFKVTFANNEILDIERIATADNKPPKKFIDWLLRVGIEIYKLTIK